MMATCIHRHTHMANLGCASQKPTGIRYLETALQHKICPEVPRSALLICKPQAQQGHRKEWAGWGCAGEVSPIVPLGLPCPRHLDSSAPQAATSANGSYRAELLLC